MPGNTTLTHTCACTYTVCLHVHGPVSAMCMSSFSHVSPASPPQLHFPRVGCSPKATITSATKTKTRRHARGGSERSKGGQSGQLTPDSVLGVQAPALSQPLGLPVDAGLSSTASPRVHKWMVPQTPSQKAVLAISPHHHPTSPSLRVRHTHFSSVSSPSSKQRVRPPAGETTGLQR